MSEEKDPMVSALELHEEFMRHLENGGAKIGKLAVLTIIVASLLAVSYLLQLVVLPFVFGVTTQTVNLVDPSLMVFELGLLILTSLWLYVGFRDYRFTRRLTRQIREIRVAEAEIMKKYGLNV